MPILESALFQYDMARIMGPSRHREDHDERDTAGGNVTGWGITDGMGAAVG
jgi:hypothetical protein